jgi:hypothetical protein
MSDPVRDLKHELLTAAQRQLDAAGSPNQAARPRRPNRVLLALSAVSVAAVIALLFVSPPWADSPEFLEKAQAALTPPAGMVLHQEWEATSSSSKYGCTVTRPTEVWLHQKFPYKYRAFHNHVGPDYLPVPPDPPVDLRELACAPGTPIEIGGTLECPGYGCPVTYKFVPPNEIVVQGGTFGLDPDPVDRLRDAIRDGRAHQQGTTEVNGHIVERIRLDPMTPCPPFAPGCENDRGYVYVDRETFHPVRIEGVGYITTPGKPSVRLNVVVRYQTYEYLPPTPANLALTDLHAQHPNATEEP